jgi:hypothetical protein
LRKKNGEIPRALSGEAVIQLLGQLAAYHLSGNKSFDLHVSAQHNFCSLNPKGCCANENGCVNALNSAFGDYMAAMIFPESPALGETAGQSVEGMKICGLDRDLRRLSAQSKSDIFNACAEKGNVTLVGAWYASLWWKARTRAEELEVGGAREVDVLFFEHARTWTAATTFNEARDGALALAGASQNGKWSALLQSVFASAQL